MQCVVPLLSLILLGADPEPIFEPSAKLKVEAGKGAAGEGPCSRTAAGATMPMSRRAARRTKTRTSRCERTRLASELAVFRYSLAARALCPRHRIT